MKNSITKKLVNFIPNFVSVIVILLLWQILSLVVDSSLIIPSPASTVHSIIEIVKSVMFWKDFLYSFTRILISFCISIFCGFILGYFCGTYKFVNHFLEFPVSLLRSTPVIALILILMFIFNSSVVPVVISVLVTLPIMITSVSQGFLACSENNPLMEMAKLYKFSKLHTVLYVKLPFAKSSIFSVIESVFGLTWKVVIAGEVLSIPKFSLGGNLHVNYVNLESGKVLGETLLIVLIIYVLERLLKCLFSSKKEAQK